MDAYLHFAKVSCISFLAIASEAMDFVTADLSLKEWARTCVKDCKSPLGITYLLPERAIGPDQFPATLHCTIKFITSKDEQCCNNARLTLATLQV